MSLALPMETLSNMQVSFRVGLPDGAFAFDMASIDTFGLAGPSSESGMKLHLRAVSDASGVTLTIFTSGHWSGRVEVEKPENVLEKDPLDFLAYTHMDGTSESLTSSYFPPDAFGALDMSLDDRSSFNNYFFDNLNVGSNSENNFEPSFTHMNLTDTSPETSVSAGSPDLSFAEDTDATTPSSTSTDSYSAPPTPPPSGARRERSKLPCPEASCTRTFTSKYTLSKHMTAHEPKSQKSFVCTLGCTMRFSRKHDRLRHEVTQHGRVCEWGCSVCLGFFSSEITLKKHKCKTTGGARWISDQG
ncbi:hypothetical protein B0H19DRAFT_1068848 [Mycena capillaripes]|nr:hypothetical protein B0H19DRAFT_1068848 [Mycena capillaripes]